MYFSGCNVASSDAGWLFLETAGQVFLRGGGYAMGWTSYGHGFKGETWRSWYNSHSMHFTGDVRIVTFRSGGSVQERLSYAGGWLTGNFFSRLLVTRKLEEIVPDDA